MGLGVASGLIGSGLGLGLAGHGIARLLLLELRIPVRSVGEAEEGVVAMLRGLIDTADIAYFLLFILMFLLLTIKQMDSQRLQG